MKSKLRFLDRGDFIKMNFLAISGFFIKNVIPFKSFDGLNLTFKGHLINAFGYPIPNVPIYLVKGFSLNAGYGFLADSAKTNVSGPTLTDANGYFEIAYSGAEINLGLTFGDTEVNSKNIINTNIPFGIVEVWHPSRRNQFNRIKDSYSNLVIVADRSRSILKDYVFNQDSGLFNSLIYSYCSKYYADHRDPENPPYCIDPLYGYGCETTTYTESHCCHWGQPYILDIGRDINLPWGNASAPAIPFIVGEGFVFEAEAQHSGDYDRIWNIQLENNYSYLTTKKNDAVSWLRNRKPAIEGEMCVWYLGQIRGNHISDTETNIRRTDELTKFINKRVWMMGSWCHDECHERQNEIHPVYWIVPFIGGVRRFLQAETSRLDPMISDSQKRIELQLGIQPENLILLQYLQIDRLFSDGSKTDLADKYATSSIHLNQFGVNQAGPGQEVSDPINSLDYQGHYDWALNQSPDMLKIKTKRRIHTIYNAISSYGSGFQIFPIILYTYETIEILKLSYKYRPRLLPPPPPLSQRSVAEEALNANPIDLPGKLTRSFHSLIDQLSIQRGDFHKEELAKLCADFLIRIERYGIIPSEFASREDQLIRFMSLGNDLIKLFLTNLIKKIWDDLLPYTRTFSSDAYQ